MRKHEILSRPTRPLTIDRRKNAAALLEKMQGISFQGRNLALQNLGKARHLRLTAMSLFVISHTARTSQVRTQLGLSVLAAQAST
jgi:hypothetical protein